MARMNWTIPLTDLDYGEEERLAVEDVLASKWLTQGGRTADFEAKFARTLGVKHAIAVSSGTAGLHLAYLAAGLREGQDFIAPALTFVATLSAGLQLGARPVLADIASADDLTLCPEDGAAKITAQTGLLVTMAYGGYCPDMAALRQLADAKGIPLVEDACHAPLAEVEGRKLGTWGDLAVFSLFSNKNLPVGEGGVVTTNRDDLAEKVRRLRSHGMTSLTWDRHRGHAADYDVLFPGYNYRFDEIRAALASCQLKKLESNTTRREKNSVLLRENLLKRKVPGLEIPFAKARGRSACHLFVALLPEGTNRTGLRDDLAEKGIQTSVHYPLPHHFTGLKAFFAEPGRAEVPRVESLSERLLTLPMGPHLDAEKIETMGNALERAIAAHRKSADNSA